MIHERHRWLLRDVATCFDYLPGADFRCRVCRTKKHGEVRVAGSLLDKHLAHHRREKVYREPRAEAVA